MTTIAAIIERVYSDYLLPPGEQPTRFTVDTDGIDDSATSLPVDTALLSPEEEDLVGVATLLEVGSELMLVEAVTGDPPTSLTVRRGMYGTTAAAHAEDDFVFLAPDFPRSVVFNAVADTIEALWPDLWTVAVEETYATTAPIELPAAVAEIVDIRAEINGKWQQIPGWDELQDFPLVSTGVAVQVGGVSVSVPLHVYYKKKATRPTVEADLLADLAVETGWVKVIAVGAVAQVIANEDIDRATVDFITQALESEGFAAGAGADLRNSLLQFQSFLLGPLKRAQDMKRSPRIVIGPR